MTGRRRLGVGVLAGLVVVLVGAWMAFLSPLSASPEAFELAEDLGEVDAEMDAWVFRPEGPSATAFVLYTGARVPAEAYSEVIAGIVERGFTVVVPKLQMELAILEPDAAADVMAALPRVKHWVVGGHSLGGVMAARFAEAEPKVEGLVLWASFPEDSVDLSDNEIEVVSIVGDRDGLVDSDEIAAAVDRLPADAVHVVIEGGNHAQFGDYGPQRGDLPPAITGSRQRQEVVEATVTVLEDITRHAEAGADGTE